jgi:serine/threonine protein kinase
MFSFCDSQQLPESVRDSLARMLMMRQRPTEPAGKIGSYLRRDFIGSGSFGQVYIGCHERTQDNVALKIIPRRALTSAKAFEALQREVQIMSTLDHPCIVNMLEYLEDEFFVYLVQELAMGDTLTKFITNQGPMKEPEARAVFDECLSAIHYLHREKRVMHRDIKSDNLVVDPAGHIHLLDFGFANIFTGASPNFETMCGSPQWVSPEMLRGSRYSTASDIWSIGILLFFITVGSLPFTGNSLPQLRAT